MNTPSWGAGRVLRAFVSPSVLVSRLVRGITSVVLTLAILTGTAAIVNAQTNADGAIVGKISGDTKGSIAIESRSTGLQRTATVAADGSYRMGSLPPGRYQVTYTPAFGAPAMQEVDVNVGSTSAADFSGGVTKLEKFVVTGGVISPIDFGKTESATVFSAALIKELPVGRSTTAVALLTPGTTQGDGSFGLVSFSGSSVAENAYYVNGFNISNFRNGLSPSSVPFDFYEQLEIKNEAYAADTGRSTGGVINGTTKSGTNQFKAGASVFFNPDRLSWKNANVDYKDSVGATQIYRYTDHSWAQSADANFYASGPIVKNKLFYYGLYQVRDSRSKGAGATTYSESRNDSPFWGGKIDFFPFKGHHLEFTGFSDTQKSIGNTYGFAFATKTKGALQNTITSNSGGTNRVYRYTGNFVEGLTLTALFGQNKFNRSSFSSVDDKPLIVDARVGAPTVTRSGNTAFITTGEDSREAFRADLEYAFSFKGSHRLRGGFDRELNTERNLQAYSGGIYWRYVSTIPGYTLPAGGFGVRERFYRNGGAFDVKNNAYYLEDNWALPGERLRLRLGLRDEGFENFNGRKESIIKIAHQWAPRLGASYDLNGDRRTKLFANYGRYMLPIAANTNYRLAGGELYTQDFYLVNSIGTDFAPSKGAKVGTSTVYSDGSVPDPATVVDQNIKSMYQDEFVIGMQRALNKSWNVGVKGIYRNLATSIDDAIMDYGLAAWAKKNNLTLSPGAHAYVLGNPGRPFKFKFDVNGDGKMEDISLSAADVGLPAAVRKYYAVELNAERVWDKKWLAQLSYTWSHSYGNSEGLVRSDNGQADAGLTSTFDSVGLMEGSYGNLPNDRRHQFKAFGAYAVLPTLSLGLNLRYSSGRPKNIFSYHPTETIAQGYGAESFFTPTGQLVPRGSLGFTKWVFYNDLSATWRPKWGRDKVSFSASITNVMNYHSVTEINEQATGSGQTPTGAYGLPAALQSPRTVRLSMSYDY